MNTRIHQHTSTNNINNSTAGYANISFLDEKRIKEKVMGIPKGCTCTVTDISPNAHCREHQYNSSYLKDHSDEIFGAIPLRHGFIVKKRGENGGADTIIFVYSGPIAHVVHRILETIH